MNEQKLEALKILLNAQNEMLLAIAVRVGVSDSTFERFNNHYSEAIAKWYGVDDES